MIIGKSAMYIFPEFFQDVQPADFRHHDIQQNQVKRFLFQEGKSLLPSSAVPRYALV
jgi:hypothetical protein